MNVKRLSAAALALATLTGAALAAGEQSKLPLIASNPNAVPEVVDVPLPSAYATQLFLNGEQLDAAHIPGAEPNLIPMRLLCESDGGFAEWYEEEEQGFFFLADYRFIVDFTDLSVELDGEKLENVAATLTEGVTFLPADVLNGLEGVTVDDNIELNVDRIDVSTPNGTPMMKLANQIQDIGEMGGMKTSLEDMELYQGEATGFKAEYMTDGVIFLPMMTSPDTVVLGKAADGKLEDLKAAFEAYRKIQEETFTQYLNYNLPKTQNAKFVTEGDWFMFYIGENADEAVEAFHAGAAELD